MINGDYRDITPYQFFHFRVIKIHTGDHHPIESTIPAMFQIRHLVVAGTVDVNKGNVISFFFSSSLEAVKNIGEVVMLQSAVGVIYKKDSEILRTICFQCLGCGVW